VTIDGTSIYRLEGAQIAEAHANWNLASMMQQLGVIEIPEEARVESRHDARQEKSEAWQELKSHA
jgi:hypothetical protein